MTDCPLCNHSFDETSENCHTGCYMSNGCPLIKCPNCGYEFVIESKTVNFFKRIIRGGKSERRSERD